MDLLVNDLSLHGQFRDVESFRAALGRIMSMRQLGLRFGRALYCHRNLITAQITPTMSMPQAIQMLSPSEKSALMQWITRQGPFWEDTRLHKEGEYLESAGEVVTDTALGEAAYCCLIGALRSLVSFAPSSWELSPIRVTLMPDNDVDRNIDVLNYWDECALEVALKASPVPISSWQELKVFSISRFPSLKFSAESFDKLRGHPFSESVSRRILELLGVLETIKNSFDENGGFNQIGQRLYQSHFVGKKAWFTDSSDTEKIDFKNELNFRHPDKPGEYLFCPWHGKVKTPQIRIHFSVPIRADEPLYVVYVGPKITKR